MTPVAAETWTFPPDPASAAEARRRVTSALRTHQLEAAAPNVSLVVSELVTNAVLHARTPIRVRVLVSDGRVRIEVHDQTAGTPRRRRVSHHATGGRGLRLVEALCEAWGADPDPDGAGKTVWAEVSTSGLAPPGPMRDRQNS